LADGEFVLHFEVQIQRILK